MGPWVVSNRNFRGLRVRSELKSVFFFLCSIPSYESFPGLNIQVVLQSIKQDERSPFDRVFDIGHVKAW